MAAIPITWAELMDLQKTGRDIVMDTMAMARLHHTSPDSTVTRQVSECGYPKCDHRLLMSSSSSVSVSRKMAESSEGGSI